MKRLTLGLLILAGCGQQRTHYQSTPIGYTGEVHTTRQTGGLPTYSVPSQRPARAYYTPRSSYGQQREYIPPRHYADSLPYQQEKARQDQYRAQRHHLRQSSNDASLMMGERPPQQWMERRMMNDVIHSSY